MSESSGQHPSHLRQVGQARVGRVCKGAPISGARLRKDAPTASIPSRAVVVPKARQESLGFTTSDTRFNYEIEEMPGPSSYLSPSAAQNVQSISKKGFGALLSNDMRFQEQLAYTGPGPGDYQVTSVQSKAANEGGGRKLPTSSFQRKQNTSVLRLLDPKISSKEITPGPGAYISHRRHSLSCSNYSNPKALASWQFRAALKDRERSCLPEQQAPPVGTYQLLQGWKKPEVSHTQFKKGSGHASKGKQAESMGVIFGSDVAHGASPGPGSYDLEHAISWQLNKASANSSAMFKETLVDRFGRAQISMGEKMDVPGPGAYVQHRTDKLAGDSKFVYSSFISTTPQISQLQKSHTQNPSPYEYNPAKCAKKSFLLNAAHKFV